ncbi:2-phosphosulfolactate phosphatase [Microbacterium stercoris]|uniref:Probable 2-phosphosulfolactate phosphatase n=1 Tax=Microbacterium stercoris TaxID=2820289 RepID=A0A939QKM8_9MICO|nr:2-phosphosulfolactate phosphatase [Microbacterium stercoris]MBO3663447.1 2-phosphosulfolactate phosphatase [Microbacterium stercoris]
MSTPFSQSTYQVRLEWGVEGLRRLEPADVYVIADPIRYSSGVLKVLAKGHDFDIARSTCPNGGAIAKELAARTDVPVVFAGTLGNATAVARAVKAEQERRQARTSVAVIAGGERTPEGDIRFAVEDLLAAGAIIDALVPLGIDHSSPEAVAAAEAFVALRRGITHLVTGSGSGRELEDDPDGRDDVRAAAKLDTTDVVPVLREGFFVAR